MMVRFRQRLTPEMLQDINDVIIGRKKPEDIVKKDEDQDKDHHDDGGNSGKPEEESAATPNESNGKMSRGN